MSLLSSFSRFVHQTLDGYLLLSRFAATFCATDFPFILRLY